MVRYSDIILDLVEKEKAEEIVLKQESKKEIDEEIREYISAINKLSFVKTLVSCAGHRNSFWDIPYVVLAFSNEVLEEVFIEAMEGCMKFLKNVLPDELFEAIKEAVDRIVVRRASGDSVVYINRKTGEIADRFSGKSVVWVAVVYRDDHLEFARQFLFDFMTGVLYGIGEGLKKREESN